MKRIFLFCTALLLFLAFTSCKRNAVVELSADDLKDKIMGGMVGQILGNINGLPYEETYNKEPGNMKYKPSLPYGAFTDDDTDIEWVYIYYMDKEKKPLLSYDTIRQMWLKHLYYAIYSSNAYGRELMALGIEPPLTGNIYVNPWSRLNVAGQFNCETFALAAPGMCRSSEEIAMHYTSVIVDQEPLQSTQLFAAMIARAFVSNDLDDILNTGLEAMDQNSITYTAVQDALAWHKQYPNDWKATRNEIRKKYYFVNDPLKCVFNTAAIIAQYQYGKGDFVKTFEIAFNWGFDADCNAATLGTIIGAMKGYKWFEQQGWNIRDRYCNTTRPGLPTDETITSFSERIARIAEQVILLNDGTIDTAGGKKIYRIKTQPSECLLQLKNEEQIFADLRFKYEKSVESTIRDSSNAAQLAKAAYLSLCLKTCEELKSRYPAKWQKALYALQQYNELLYFIDHAVESPVKKLAANMDIHVVNPQPGLSGNTEFKLKGYPDAKSVLLGGTMNGWESWKTPMQKTDDGWMCKIDLDHGKYEYKFIVDGQTIFDPDNTLQETNCEGRTNSIVIVP